MGSIAWQEYRGEEDDRLPPPSSATIDCVSLDTIPLPEFQAGDTACEGDKYVWECRDVSAQDWCNIHLPTSALGYLAWELIDGVPNSVTVETMEIERNESRYEEPSQADLLAQMN